MGTPKEMSFVYYRIVWSGQPSWFAQDFPGLALKFSHPGTSSVPDKPGRGPLIPQEACVPNIAVPHV